MSRTTRWALVALAVLVSTPAAARTTRELPYAYERVWPVLVRFLRVDEKLKLTEKDEANGYVLFELADGKRTFPGAAELARTVDGAGRTAVRCVLRIDDRPSYMEDAILERLATKLHEELGEPPPPPPRAPEPDAPAKERP